MMDPDQQNRSWKIGSVQLDMVPGSAGQSAMFRLLDMDSALVIELRGCQPRRLNAQMLTWLTEHKPQVRSAEEVLGVAGQLQDEGCTCHDALCAARL
ncbi:hypothetical protein ACL02S_11590 [Nocardia sp. 004]|uniref:hypothetical protein n=1 Tax=Nocardia sp. 004 TaxID=3385978 RepID=UPI0039A28CF8